MALRRGRPAPSEKPTATWPFWPSGATAGARCAPTAISMWSCSTGVTATSKRWPTPSGTRSGTRACTSITRFGSPAEVLSAAADDVRVALGLLDARLVWGDAKVADPLVARARTAWRESLGTRYLPDLEAQMRDRHRGVGDVAFLLEPDLKESHGGLRDVNVLRAISAYAPLLADYADLASLEPATALLTRVRVELHRIAGREQDRLLLQDQDQIAAALAFDDADVLMAAVSAAGRQIAWVSDDVWRRRRLWDPSPPPRQRRWRRRRRRPDGDRADPRRAPTWSTSAARSRSSRARRSPRTPRSPFAWPPLRPSSTGPSPRDRCTAWPTACRRRETRGPRRCSPPCCASWPPGDPPSTRSSHSTSTGSWCGSSPSGPPSATSPSATPTTPIPSIGTSWRPPHWRQGSPTGSSDPTSC